MRGKVTIQTVVLAVCSVSGALAAGNEGRAVLWTDPGSIARDLYYGPGGKEHQPKAPYKFEKEDLEGTSPKFVVRDGAGVKWKAKLGLEARPETVATRLVWAAGYYATEDYFLPEMKVDGMPARLHRGQKLVAPGGILHNVRLKREDKDEKKIGTWAWDKNPFTGTREWNGLRVLMALINNWDLKDVNNAIFRVDDKSIYLVSDLGASFGAAGRAWPRDSSKDNLAAYRASRFIRAANDKYVDFQTPARPRWMYFVNPKEYFVRVHLEHLGKNVPREDAKWAGQLMARLSADQLRDAFRAGGYSPSEIQALVKLIQSRIAALTDL